MGESDALVRLVKSEMVRQLYELQTGANLAEFFVRYGQQSFVAYRFSCRIRPFTGLHDCEFS